MALTKAATHAETGQYLPGQWSKTMLQPILGTVVGKLPATAAAETRTVATDIQVMPGGGPILAKRLQLLRPFSLKIREFLFGFFST